MPHGMVGVEPMTFWSYWATLPIELHPSMTLCAFDRNLLHYIEFPCTLQEFDVVHRIPY